MTCAPELRTAAGVQVLSWPVLDALDVGVVVTTRHGGVSTGPYQSLNLALHVGDDPCAVEENRRRAAAALGASLDDLVVAVQVHGANAAVVTQGDAGRGAHRADDALGGVDALVTDTAGPVLVTLVADCVPIVLVDPDRRVLATVHAGWRGTVAGVVGSALAAMASLGGRPERVVAAMGPAVSGATYTVGQEVADAVVAVAGEEAAKVLQPDGPGRWRLDLPGANLLQLTAAGVPEHAVHRAPFVTGDGRFFSDRAARPCGRFGLLARLR